MKQVNIRQQHIFTEITHQLYGVYMCVAVAAQLHTVATHIDTVLCYTYRYCIIASS